MSDSALRELADDPSSRKRFLKMVGGAGAVSAFGILLAACGDDDEDEDNAGAAPEGGGTDTGASEGSPEGDLAILNYALTLEFLEADFYKQVVDANIIEDQAVADVAKQFGETEQTHVEALMEAITGMGGTPVEAPMTAFESVLEGGPTMVLETAATVENLGAAAYLGAAPMISSPEVLASALAIHSVEARHAAALAAVIMAGFQGDGPLNGSIPDGAFAKPMTEEQVLEAVQPFLA